jgi:hypothetical protein
MVFKKGQPLRYGLKRAKALLKQQSCFRKALLVALSCFRLAVLVELGE